MKPQPTSAPAQPAPIHRPFEVRIGDAFYGGDGSPESIQRFAEQLPDAFNDRIPGRAALGLGNRDRRHAYRQRSVP